MDKIWGVECSIDLKGCDPNGIRAKDYLEDFLILICEEIKVKTFGRPIVVRFGEGDKIAGFSIVQLIETSLISGHFVESTNAAYINIFSCKEFDPVLAADFTKKYFAAESMEFMVNYRSI